MIDFPASPTNGQVFTTGGATWIWSAADSAWQGGAAMGPQGVPGQSANLFEYSFNTTLTEPPSSAEVRFNSATPSAVTKVWAAHTTYDAIDVRVVLGLMAANDRITIQDRSDSTKIARYVLNGVPVEKTGYTEFPVTFLNSGNALTNGRCILAIVRAGVAGPQGPQGAAGAQGTQGPTGAQGPQGTQGTTGVGVQGAQGGAGTQGAQGPAGAQGPQGVAGTGGGGGASVNIGATPPGSPTAGDMWWDSTTGTLRIRYNDGNTTQWVDAVSQIVGAPGRFTISDTAPSSPAIGDVWWRSTDGNSFIRYDDGTSTQWVAFVGAMGPQGLAGAAGAQGPQGAGTQGAQGAAGGAGTQGPQGFQGPAGTGAQGAQGAQGAASSVAGPQGTQGNQGVPGSGAQGNQGAQGAQGAAGGTTVLTGMCGTQASITSATLVDITGMTVALVAGTYWFEARIHGQVTTASAGAQFGVGYTGTVTSMEANFLGQTTGVAFAAAARITTKSVASTLVMTTAGAECVAMISGQIIVSTSGNLTIQGLKVTNQTLVVRVGSWLSAIKTA